MCLFKKKPVKFVCPNCKHEWTMSKMTYLSTPYAQRGINQLFVCAKCGSQGRKV